MIMLQMTKSIPKTDGHDFTYWKRSFNDVLQFLSSFISKKISGLKNMNLFVEVGIEKELQRYGQYR